MYTLTIFQNRDLYVDIGIFPSIEEGRKFLRSLDAYVFDDEGLEYIDIDKLGKYEEIEFNGHVFPLTRDSFNDFEHIYIDWRYLPYYGQRGEGMVPLMTKVDSYMINNEEVGEYIRIREEKYELVKSYLEGKSYEVRRGGFMSEDGEYIIYMKDEDEGYIFLTHMDPNFVYDFSLMDLKGL